MNCFGAVVQHGPLYNFLGPLYNKAVVNCFGAVVQHWPLYNFFGAVVQHGPLYKFLGPLYNRAVVQFLGAVVQHGPLYNKGCCPTRPLYCRAVLLQTCRCPVAVVREPLSGGRCIQGRCPI